MNRIVPVLMFFALLAVLTITGCGDPLKYSHEKISLCGGPRASLGGLPYQKDADTCAEAIRPFDLSVWSEAAYNSHKTRGLDTAQLGCKPLTSGADNCAYTGPTGHSLSLMMNFDPTIYPDDARVRRAMLGVYSTDNPAGLQQVQLRGRLSVGGDLASLGLNRGSMVPVDAQTREGWVFFDVTHFVARAINERRTSIHFELSLPCQTPATNLVTVGVNQNEPQLVVEFN